MYLFSVKIRRTIARVLVALFCINSFSIPLSAVVSYPQLDMEMHVGPEYITITTQALEGLNLKMVISEIVKQAEEQGIVDELPAGMLHCYKMIQDGHDAVHYKDLNEALPLIIEKLLPSMVVDADGNVVEKAIRPTDGVAGCAPIVGAVGCDLIPVLNLLAKIKALIIIDFAATWTILADLKDTVTIDFAATWTILADIKDTLTTCCENIQNDFEATWTVLADIKDTLTTCCENIQNDFESTWTILADIKETMTVDFAGVFTALNACCENITKEFQETWTILADIKDTLTTCCEQTQDNFESTWTILADIKDTLTTCCEDVQAAIADLTDIVIVDFAGVFTALDACCGDITREFQETWTILADIQATLTTCCEDVQDAIADLSDTVQIDFAGTWTLIETCCEDLSSQLDAIAADIADLQVTVEVDFAGVFTAIDGCCEDLSGQIAACCEGIQESFVGTWTILSNLEVEVDVDFDGVYTSIADVKTTVDACCEDVQAAIANLGNELGADVAGVFTAIEGCCEDLSGQIAACCEGIQESFVGTWTILSNLEVDVDFDSVYTTIADVKTTVEECCQDIQAAIAELGGTVEVDLAGIFTALEDCCQGLQDQMSILGEAVATDFVGIFTAIDECCEQITTELHETLTTLQELALGLSGGCDVAKSVTGPMTITESGYYCLKNNINGLISIAASSVVLDLNGFTITSGADAVAIEITPFNDIRITNGEITAPDGRGITCVNGSQTIAIDNLIIFGCSLGVQLIEADGVTIDGLVFKENSRAIFSDTTNNLKVRSTQFYQNTTVADLSLIDLLNGDGSNNILFESCSINNNTLQGAAYSMLIRGSVKNVQVNQCTFNSNTGDSDFAAVRVDTCQDVIFTNCEFNRNSSSGAQCAGLWVSGGSNCQILSCVASQNTNDTFAVGYLIDGAATDCCVLDSSANSHTSEGAGRGMRIDGLRCYVARNKFIGNDVGLENTSASGAIGMLNNYSDGIGGGGPNYIGVLPVSDFSKVLGTIIPGNPFDNISALVFLP